MHEELIEASRLALAYFTEVELACKTSQPIPNGVYKRHEAAKALREALHKIDAGARAQAREAEHMRTSLL